MFEAIYIFDEIAFQIPLSTSSEEIYSFIAYEFENNKSETNGYKILKGQVSELLGSAQ